MNKVVEFLNANPVQYLATVGRDGKAKCRPFMFAGEMDRKLWFCTNNTKDVYKDIQANPEIEVSVSSPSYAWLRLHGKAVFENNMAAKEMCIANPIVKGQYGEATNPIFEVFYLKNAQTNRPVPAMRGEGPFYSSYAFGNVTLIVVPLPTWLCRSMRAWCSRAICLTMASPRPVPPVALLRLLSTR